MASQRPGEYDRDVKLRKDRTSKEAKVPLYLMADLALGGGWPIDKAPNPSVLLVDDVRVYPKRSVRARPASRRFVASDAIPPPSHPIGTNPPRVRSSRPKKMGPQGAFSAMNPSREGLFHRFFGARCPQDQRKRMKTYGDTMLNVLASIRSIHGTCIVPPGSRLAVSIWRQKCVDGLSPGFHPSPFQR
jgi:hypothetical protein